MKKITFAAFALLSSVAFVACDNAGDEYHGTTIYNRGGGSSTEMFADQTIDSLHVVSYDSWTATLDNVIGGEWCTLSDMKCNVPPGYVVAQSVIINTTPNTTGVSRLSVFKVRSAWGEFGELSSGITQYGWHNITVPQPRYTSSKLEECKAVFADSLLANTKQALLACSVYAEATLESDAVWLIIPDDAKTLAPGDHGVQMPMLPNETSEDRIAHVTLTSNGVSDVITYKQKGKK